MELMPEIPVGRMKRLQKTTKKTAGLREFRANGIGEASVLG